MTVEQPLDLKAIEARLKAPAKPTPHIGLPEDCPACQVRAQLRHDAMALIAALRETREAGPFVMCKYCGRDYSDIWLHLQEQHGLDPA